MTALVSLLGRTVVAACVGTVLCAAGPDGKAFAAPPLEGEMRNFVVTMPPRPVPDVPFLDATGAEHRFSEYRGKVVLVNFWASWCAACIVEMPSLDRLQARLGGGDFTVLALAQQSGDPRTVGAFLKKRGLTHLVVVVDDKRELGRRFDQSLFPTTVLLDRHGREVGRLVGPAEWDSPEAAALIRYFMRGEREQTTGERLGPALSHESILATLGTAANIIDLDQ